MKIAIRTDSSSVIGSGHMMRCKTLADLWRDRGAEVRFVCREHPGNLNHLLRNAAYDVRGLPPGQKVPPAHDQYAFSLGVESSEDAAQTLEALVGFSPDWLVVDHYALDADWERLLRASTRRVLAIDDLANRPHDCDLLLDQNWFGDETERRYDGLVNARCTRLLGPRYAVLQPIYPELRKVLPPRDGFIRQVLVFLGGVDSSNQTTKALQALSAPDLRDLEVHVVVGNANLHEAEIEKLVANRPHTALFRDLPNLAGLMARTDLALGAGGATTWERCCLGLPSIVVAVAENQRGFTTTLAKQGVQQYLGLAGEVEPIAWTLAVQQLRKSREQVRAYAVAAQRMTDGLGVYRVAAIMEDKPMSLRLRRAGSADEVLLLEWANDPTVRRHAFSHETIGPEAHRDWFRNKLADSKCLFLIGEDGHGLPVGQVRFDRRAQETIVDISIDKALRGRGVGRALLRNALEVLRADGGNSPIVADILAENQASRRIFLRAGFRHTGPSPGQDGSLRFVLTR